MELFNSNSSSTRPIATTGQKRRGMKAALLGTLLTIVGAETSVASPAEEARIAGVISAVAVYADNRDFRPLERFFAPETTIDYTSLWGGEPQRFAPSALMDAWADLLPGFDATRHEISDIQVEIGDDAATAQARVRATHWLGDRTWVVAGSYDYALIRADTGWQVSRMTLHLTDESGDRTLVEKAAAKVAGAK
jgi:hypothetical protein